MPNKKHHVKLTTEERTVLSAIARKKNAAAIKVQKAKALLAMDSGVDGAASTDAEASVVSGLTARSLERLRARTCESGPLGALERKPREAPPREPKVTGEIEAYIAQIACSEAPEGRSRWTLQMIAGRLVELELVESIAKETVRTTLKKMTLNPGSRSAGVSRRRTIPGS
jgi:hypothetical protein